jgi:hypothetical protein
MVWVLVWIQMTASQGVEYYQINSFPKKEECAAALEVEYYQINSFPKKEECAAALDKAQVMLNHQGEAVVCLEVKVK